MVVVLRGEGGTKTREGGAGPLPLAFQLPLVRFMAYSRKSLWHARQTSCNFSAAALTWAARGVFCSSDLMNSLEASCISLEYPSHFLMPAAPAFVALSLGLW